MFRAVLRRDSSINLRAMLVLQEVTTRVKNETRARSLKVNLVFKREGENTGCINLFCLFLEAENF